MVKIAINGFGRIGRTFLRTILSDKKAQEKIEVCAINIGSGNPEHIAHLFKYDSIMGILNEEVKFEKGNLIINHYTIKIISELDPTKIDWKKNDVEMVVDCTGKFTDGKKAAIHLQSGAKYVLISAPAKNEDVSLVLGVNDKIFDPKKHKIISIGSCTTNALLPILKVINDEFKINFAYMTTTHAYTNSQVLLDVEKPDIRRSRAAALNMIPTTSGAVKMVGKIIPELNEKVGGCAIRVPTADVSLIDLSFTAGKEFATESINEAFKKAANNSLKGILDFTMLPLVSCDFKGNSHSVTVDGLMTQTTGNIAKVFGWYDNEWGYSCRLRDFITSHTF